MTTDRTTPGLVAGGNEERIGGIAIEALVAYADGELAPEAARRVEAALSGNSEAEAALAAMRRSAAAVRHAFDAPLDAPVPERLRAPFVRPTAAISRPFPGPLSRRLLPLAASIAALAVGLALGFGADRLLGTGGTKPGLRLAAGPASGQSGAFEAALLRALEAGLDETSYADAETGLRGTVTLLGQVETSFGLPCREFRDVRAGASGDAEAAGLACRRADGGWEVTILSSSAGGGTGGS